MTGMRHWLALTPTISLATVRRIAKYADIV